MNSALTSRSDQGWTGTLPPAADTVGVCHTGRSGAGVPVRRGGLLRLSLLGILVALGGCTDAQKKLSGGSPSDILIYDILKQKRPTSYYYEVVSTSHDEERFCYRCTDDPFLVDKSIDAVNQLGDVPFARLEGQAVVVGTLTEVLLEDPSALAQAGAAGSLTKIAAKLPDYPQRGPEDSGTRVVSLLREMDSLHTQAGVRHPDDASTRRLGEIITQLGDLQITDLVLAKESIRPFHNRSFLVDEKDPTLRRAIDTALTKRLRALILVALDAAVSAESPWVRADAIRGLKLLAVTDSLPVVVQQITYDPNQQVRSEGVEYLGRIGSAEAVGALLPLLGDADPSVAHKARESLRRIAGQDFGRRNQAWTRWAKRRFPSLRELEEDASDEDLDVGLPPIGPSGPGPDVGGPAPRPPVALPPVAVPPTGAPTPVQPRPSLPIGTGPTALTPVAPVMPVPETPVRRGALPEPVVRTVGGTRVPARPLRAAPVPAAPGRPVSYSGARPPPPPVPGAATTPGVPVRGTPLPVRRVPAPPPPPPMPRTTR